MAFNVRAELARFLREDNVQNDITSSLITNKIIGARIVSREQGVIAGIRFTSMLFAMNGCRSKILKKDGSTIHKNQTVLIVTGPARKILSCERTALNLLSRMSGIATTTNQLARMIKNTNARLYSTRKTAPGLRYFDKEAVEMGGGKKHRVTLADMIMIKDNHIAAEGSLEILIQRARKKDKIFEVEVETEKDAILAAKMGASIIMLDNFTVTKIRKTIASLDRLGLRDKVKIEASGGISSANIVAYAKSGVDMISMGSITNSVKAIDFSLEV
ncbi:MAG: carboxylating nicotinate-nucleotide diphosphorylase [Candidatus Nitrosotenuis sp.]|nr:carboxylating nicotinate-nucleotide diphosphorylase [Candidatus Nitrosotenuis uzonensis]